MKKFTASVFVNDVQELPSLGEDSEWLEKVVTNPATGNKVKVKSLPAKERERYKPADKKIKKSDKNAQMHRMMSNDAHEKGDKEKRDWHMQQALRYEREGKKKMKEATETSEEGDLEMLLSEGEELTPKSYAAMIKRFGEEKVIDYCLKNNVTFSVDYDDLEEVHLYKPDSDHFGEHGFNGWPVMSLEKNFLRLESVYGNGKEDWVLATKVTVG